jgi:cytochrome c2
MSFFTVAVVPARAADIDGKKVFLDQKCNLCHAVSSADIQATGKIKSPDLSTVAVEDAAKLKKYLRKEETLKNKKHVKAFAGSDDELAAVVAWLQKQGKGEKK